MRNSLNRSYRAKNRRAWGMKTTQLDAPQLVFSESYFCDYLRDISDIESPSGLLGDFIRSGMARVTAIKGIVCAPGRYKTTWDRIYNTVDIPHRPVTEIEEVVLVLSDDSERVLEEGNGYVQVTQNGVTRIDIRSYTFSVSRGVNDDIGLRVIYKAGYDEVSPQAAQIRTAVARLATDLYMDRMGKGNGQYKTDVNTINQLLQDV